MHWYKLEPVVGMPAAAVESGTLMLVRFQLKQRSLSSSVVVLGQIAQWQQIVDGLSKN